MINKKFLITRQYSRAKELSHFLQENNHQTNYLPLFNVNTVKLGIDIEEFNAVIISSVNAIEALSKLNIRLNIIIYCVGRITAIELRKRGFNNIKIAKSQNAKSLKELIIYSHDPKDKILYLCAPNITLDFTEELKKYNILVKKYIAYNIKPIKIAQEDFSNIMLDYILIFSSNSAKLFLNLVNKNKSLKNTFLSAKILCLSDKIIAEFKDSDFKKIEHFAQNEILKQYYRL